MEAAESFVVALKAERAEEMARREHRRQQRNEFLVRIEKQRTVRSLERLHGNLWRQVSMTSSMEENLLNVVCRTAKWWGMLCRHAVDQRLQLERAEQNKTLQQEDYLKNVQRGERREAESTLASDEKRWELIQEAHLVEENDARAAAVADALDMVFHAVDRGIDFVDTFSVASSRTDPVVAFALHDVISSEVAATLTARRQSDRRASRSAVSVRKAQIPLPPRDPPSAAEVATDAFRVLFGHNPFRADDGDASFRRLVACYYHRHLPAQTAASIYDVSQIPVIVVSGPKLSGKSVLAASLAEKFGFQTVSPLDLVGRALHALADEEDESERVESDLPPESSEHAWASLGRRVRTELQQGRAVGAELLAELLAVRLGDAQKESFNGLIMEGLLSRPAEYDALYGALIPPAQHPFPRLQPYVQDDNAARATVAGSQNAAHGSGEQRTSSSTMLNELPQPWQLRRLVAEDSSSKKEQKARGTKKAGDASSLPPPVLPALEDVSADIAKEQQFIADAERELAALSGVFSSYIRIDCSPREVFNRFAGLRVDSETGEEYHMTYRPPPQERMPFLVNADRTGRCSAHLHSLVFAQERQWEAMEAHFCRDESTHGRVVHLQGECTIDSLCQQGEDVTNQTLERFVAGQRLFLAAREAKDRVRRLQEQRARQAKAREGERTRLVELYEEKNVPLPPELLAEEETTDFYPVPKDLPAAVLSIASSMVDQYTADYAWGWSALRDSAQLLFQYQRGCESSMAAFWGCPDGKQETLDRFVNAFNVTPSALRCKPACKDELHRYVSDLSDALYVQVDNKQRDCVARMQQLTRRETFLEGWQTMAANTGTFLAQAEVERFVVTLNATLLHFAALMSEPLTFEDFDMDASLLHMVTNELPVAAGAGGGGAGESGSSGAPPVTRTGRDGRKAASVKKSAHTKSTDETAEHAVEDAFNDVVQRLTTALEGLVEKVRDTAEPNAKTQKKTAAPNAARLVALATACLPPLETELAATTSRLQKIKAFVGEMLHKGEQHAERIRSELQSASHERFVAQAAAVNTAVYMLRNCIEQEISAPSMHLGCGTFAVLGDAPCARPTEGLTGAAAEPSFLTDVPLYGEAQQAYKALVHPTLSIQRLLQLVRYFRSVAPNFQLSRSDFCLEVREEDYRGAALAGETVKSVPEVFAAFDQQGVELVDWRGFVVHLLFWCCAPPCSAASPAARALYIREPTVEELLETKADLGLVPVSHDVFVELPFFYDDALEAERLEGYTTALWLTFENPETHTLDPFQLLWCLCADAQPIRGVQKAFYVLSSVDEGRLNLAELHRVFHADATNAQVVGKPDPFAEPHLQCLIGDAASVSFPEACVSVMGRKLLNSADAFRRRRFTTV